MSRERKRKTDKIIGCPRCQASMQEVQQKTAFLGSRAGRPSLRYCSTLYFRMHHSARTPSRQPIFLPSA
jgi:hypothetical protein